VVDRRVVAPLFIGTVGAILAFVFREAGRPIGWCEPITGCLPTIIFAAAPIGALAGWISASWQGAVALVAGFVIGGVVVWTAIEATAGSMGTLVDAAGGMAILMSFLGLPAYALAAIVPPLFRRRRAR
jgi:hypothetical protein